jgi:hypothetical protein
MSRRNSSLPSSANMACSGTVKKSVNGTFCGCETWSLALWEQHRLRVFENRVLRRVFGPKRDEVTGEWRKLHNKEIHDIYSSINIISQIKSRRMRWAGHAARMGKERRVYKVLEGMSEGKSPLGRSRIDGRMASEWILGTLASELWSGFGWLRILRGGRLLRMR